MTDLEKRLKYRKEAKKYFEIAGKYSKQNPLNRSLLDLSKRYARYAGLGYWIKHRLKMYFGFNEKKDV